MRITIDVDANVSEMIESWKNGNLTHVINALASDHAGLTAVLLVQGLADGTLTRTDTNRIANMLIDRRVEMVNR